jgi:hypothetical protein
MNTLPRTRGLPVGSHTAFRARDAAFIVMLALLASIAGLLNDFVYDDVPLIQDNARVHDLGAWRTLLTAPYWPAPFVEQLYRPVAVVLIAFQWALGRGDPIVFRIVSYLLYAACAGLLLRFVSKLVSRPAAFAACALFAVHPVHVEAVALGVNQGEIIVAILGLIMTDWYVDKRRNGRLAVRDWCIIAALYAIGTFTKENAFVLPLFLVAAELLLVGDQPLSTRPSTNAVGLAMLIALGVALLLVRATVLGHSLAVVPNEAFRDTDFFERMMIMLQVATIWARLLFWPARLQADYVRNDLVHPGSFGFFEASGLVLTAGAVTAVWVFRRRNPVLAFGIAWVIVSLIPVANILPTGIILAERTLFLPSVGLAIAVAAVLETLLNRVSDRLVMRRCIWAAWVVLVTLGIVRSDQRHRVWNTAHLHTGRRPLHS